MGTFNHALRDALTRLNITQSTLAERLAIKPSQVSRWLSSSTLPDPASLPRILAAFDPADQSALAAAYCADLMPPEARHLISITPTGSTIQEQPPEREWPAGLSTDSKRKLCQFAALLRDYPEVEAIVDEFLRLAEKLEIEPLPTPRPPRENGKISRN